MESASPLGSASRRDRAPNVESREGAVALARARPSSVAVGTWLDLQRTAGNRSVRSLIQAKPTVGGHRTKAPVVQREGDQGGKADVTNLEQDMRDVLGQWEGAAKDGVSLFVTQQLSGRLDALESGSYATFLKSLIGNTIWAGAAFTPVGMAARAFAISMAGIAVAAEPTIPKPSKSALPEVQKLMLEYIDGIYDKLNAQLRTKAAELLRVYPSITRYSGIAEFVKASFAKGTYQVDPSNEVIPKVEKGAVRELFLRKATDRLDVFTAIGGHQGGSEYMIDEVAWIRGAGSRTRLALVTTDFFVSPENGMPHDFRRWIPDESAPMAIDRWKSHPLSEGKIRTYDAVDVMGIKG
jgi:hypothetical protein